MLLGLIRLRLRYFSQFLYLDLLRVVGGIIGLQTYTIFAGD